jgi:hypothetical protein
MGTIDGKWLLTRFMWRGTVRGILLSMKIGDRKKSVQKASESVEQWRVFR